MNCNTIFLHYTFKYIIIRIRANKNLIVLCKLTQYSFNFRISFTLKCSHKYRICIIFSIPAHTISVIKHLNSCNKNITFRHKFAIVQRVIFIIRLPFFKKCLFINDNPTIGDVFHD